MVGWLVLIGSLLVPTAAFLLWSRRGSRNDMALMRVTETTRAADVARLPAGNLVEVKGRLRCASPVTGELSKRPCAHCVTTIERDYEVWEYDAKHKTSCRKRKSQVVESNTLSAPFEIEDKSGRVTVLPEGAIIEGIAAIDRYDDYQPGKENEGLMQTALWAVTDSNRTLGFRYKETHLPLDVEIYVLGIAGKNHAIGAPAPDAKGQRFLISVKSEEARTMELGSKSKWMLGSGVACLLGAVISLGSAFWLARHGLNQDAPPQEIQQDRSWGD